MSKKKSPGFFVSNLDPQARVEYGLDSLEESQVGSEPLELFSKWLADAERAGLREPNAMAVATANINAVPSVRMLLIKEYSDAGFVFFTNYKSQKGRELNENPHASALSAWLLLERQVRVDGIVTKIESETSKDYFATRPRGAQISAAISNQSSVVAGRSELEQARDKLAAEYENEPVPCPENWGGYLLKHERIEFWQGRANRLHDRLRYTRGSNGLWKLERLAP